MLLIRDLWGKFSGQAGWVVGKGPSLLNLRRETFGPGPVITINEAILVVQGLAIDNPLYSLQKDGCGTGPNRCEGECRMPPPMVYPHRNIPVIVQSPDYSSKCLPRHSLKYAVDPIEDLNLGWVSVMSVRMAITILKKMGCTSINMVCCDSLAGDFRSVEVQKAVVSDSSRQSGRYAAVVPDVLDGDLSGVPYSVIIPTGERNG